MSFSVEDCKRRYRGTKLAKAKELQPELINFAQFGVKFSKSRFWVSLVQMLLLVPKQLVFDCKCCNRPEVSFSVEDCKRRYRGTKLAKAKKLQQELINFAQFGEKFSKSRFWVSLVQMLLLVQKQLVFDCKCCNRPEVSVYTMFAQFDENCWN